MYKVSVIIPVWNQEKLIIKCLDSIPNRPDIQVIVVNDGSTDNTENAIITYNKLDYLTYKYQANSGQGVARDEGVKIAEGEFIYFLDSDDYLLTDNWLKVIDKGLLDSYDVILGCSEFNNGNIGQPGSVLNNSFIRRSLALQVKHTPMLKTGEDCQWADKFRKKFSFKELKTDIIFFHYNYPREGSCTWNRRHGIKN